MKLKIFTLLAGFSLYLLIVAAGCDDTITSREIDEKDIPDKNVSFSEHIYPVFQAKCSMHDCHDSFSRAGGLDLTQWATTVADPSIVFPYEPGNSRLVWAVRGESTTPMPPVGYPTLTLDQIEGIETWIAEGAQNN